MAVLNYTILGQFSTIFLFFLMFFVGYGLLQSTKMFGLQNNKGLSALISAALSLLLVGSQLFVTFAEYMLPWLSVVLLVAFFMFFFARMFNPSLAVNNIMENNTVMGLFVGGVAIIFLFAMSNAIGQDVLDAQTGVDTSQLSDVDIATGQSIPEDTFIPIGQDTISVSSGPIQAGATTDRRTNIITTFFHPNVLGMLFLLLAAMIAIFMLSR